MLFYHFTEKLTNDNISATQLKLQHSIAVAMPENAPQHW